MIDLKGLNGVEIDRVKKAYQQGTSDTVDKAIELLKEYPLVTAMGKIKELAHQSAEADKKVDLEQFMSGLGDKIKEIGAKE